MIRSWIAAFIREGQAAGAFRAMPAEQAAAIAFGMVEGGMSRAFVRPAEADAIAAMLAEAVERWVLIRPSHAAQKQFSSPQGSARSAEVQ